MAHRSSLTDLYSTIFTMALITTHIIIGIISISECTQARCTSILLIGDRCQGIIGLGVTDSTSLTDLTESIMMLTHLVTVTLDSVVQAEVQGDQMLVARTLILPQDRMLEGAQILALIRGSAVCPPVQGVYGAGLYTLGIDKRLGHIRGFAVKADHRADIVR